MVCAVVERLLSFGPGIRVQKVVSTEYCCVAASWNEPQDT